MTFPHGLDMEIDGVLLEIGESGPQQLRYGALLCLVKLYHPLHTLQYTFVARHTQVRWRLFVVLMVLSRVMRL